MGLERVLQAVHRVGLALVVLAGTAHAERVAVIDLGPDDAGAARAQLAEAVAAAGFELVTGDGVDGALAGENVDGDRAVLAAALASAETAYAALDCKATLGAAATGIGPGAARHAAGLRVPELEQLMGLELVCADQLGDRDRAHRTASRLRALGATPTVVPAALWATYPDVDTLVDRDLIPVTIGADVAGAEVFVDFRRVGTVPVATTLAAGEHVVAVAKDNRRGYALGTAVKSQPQIVVPTQDGVGTWSAVSQRVVLWSGTRPSPAELGWVLSQVNARVALVRSGGVVQVWGRGGLAEAPRQLGNEDGEGKLDEAGRLLELARERVTAWNDRAPDPDRELLVEPRGPGDAPAKDVEEPTRWWVYAAVLGAVAIGAGLIYYESAGTDIQRIEVHSP